MLKAKFTQPQTGLEFWWESILAKILVESILVKILVESILAQILVE